MKELTSGPATRTIARRGHTAIGGTRRLRKVPAIAALHLYDVRPASDRADVLAWREARLILVQ